MVTLIPKRKRRVGIVLSADVLKQNRQLIFGFGFLIFVILLYGIVSIYEGTLNSRIMDVDNKLTALDRERDINKENAVVLFDARLSKLRSILDEHIYSSKLFDFIESITHPKVQFTNLSFRSREGILSLNGLTQSYATFGEQINALKSSEKVKDLVISDVKLLKTGQVEFAVTFNIDKSLYK